MYFESEILSNFKISENYFNGEYKFDFLPNVTSVYYSITNTIEDTSSDKLKNNGIEKFTDLENLFIKFIHFLNENEFENYKVNISKKLANESLRLLKPEAREKERKRICKEIYLDSISIEWRKDFWDFEKDEIIYNEKYEIVLGFIDNKHLNNHNITVEINSDNLEISDAFIE